MSLFTSSNSDTYLSSSMSNISYVSPITNTLSFVTPTITTAITPVILTNPIHYTEIDTGLNDSWSHQRQMTEHVFYKILDFWLYKDEMKNVLKYMKIEDGKVTVVKNKSEYETNDLSNDSKHDLEKKSQYIEENMLSMKVMKKLLMKIISELGYKWKNFASHNKVTQEEKHIVGVVKRYLKNEFNKMLS